ncbi:hypothetical protein MPSEU_000934500 [Mayamaea pseudoterrestris]|nr:hypothetical protein MPSEU_000934500 [Mayamaea pseudoterrestris]
MSSSSLTQTSASGTLLQLAAFLGASGVGLGAVGAHAFQQTLLARNTLKSYQTAVLYHLLHAVALVGVSAHIKSSKSVEQTKLLLQAGQAMGVGACMFSGSIYLLSFGLGPKKLLGPTTPIGGLLMIGGWVMLGFASK